MKMWVLALPREWWGQTRFVAMGEWAGETVGPDVWETCRDLIPAAMFADLYPSANGSPGMPPQMLGAAITLQALHGLSDLETVQELRCDLRWKAECGLGLNDTAFDPSQLAYFRRRLARSARPNRLFDAVRDIVDATGVLKGRPRFLTDRLDGLGDAPRPGRERTVIDEQVAELVRMTLETKPKADEDLADTAGSVSAARGVAVGGPGGRQPRRVLVWVRKVAVGDC
ncbi:transposase [Kitasatospora sp. NPDC052868]|uniref:transposase n=1 Tax=Kitasatospora sp. NPDC052868 TaxID=3364060 RepID=UPI0037CB23FD